MRGIRIRLYSESKSVFVIYFGARILGRTDGARQACSGSRTPNTIITIVVHCNRTTNRLARVIDQQNACIFRAKNIVRYFRSVEYRANSGWISEVALTDEQQWKEQKPPPPPASRPVVVWVIKLECCDCRLYIIAPIQRVRNTHIYISSLSRRHPYGGLVRSYACFIRLVLNNNIYARTWLACAPQQ